jgi:hypothetical protein
MRGLAKRRFEEAALFGLYNPNATQPSADEAKQIYRMLQVHRRDILDYENAFGQLPIPNMAVAHPRASQGDWIAAAQTQYPTLAGLPQPDYLVNTLNRAKTVLLADLPNRYGSLSGLNPSDYLSTAIFLGDPAAVNTLNALIYRRKGDVVEFVDFRC